MATYIRGSNVANATSYTLYRKSGGTYTPVETKNMIDFEVSALSLPAGDYVFAVKARAEGYADSEYSNELTYTVAFKEGVNKFNPNDEDYNPNQYLDASHEWKTRTNFGESGYVACSGGDLLRAGRIEAGEWKPNKSSYVHYYDADKNWIAVSDYAEAIDGSETDFGYIIPDGAAYCRVTVRTDFVDAFMITINEDAAPTEYVPYGM